MFKFSFLDILKNFFILLPFIKRISQFHHKTGILNDRQKVNHRISELSNIIVTSKIHHSTILEIGPGQTFDVIAGLSKNLQISNAYAVDVRRYFSDEFWLSHGICFLYKTTHFLQESSVDFIYCYDVLEHIKDPFKFLCEMRRLISNSGVIFISWDLRDHLHLDSESKWFEMHKYSDIAWKLQMSNRSSYVNRLLYDDWLRLFELSKFKFTVIESLNSTIAANNFFGLYGARVNSTFRVKAILSPI